MPTLIVNNVSKKYKNVQALSDVSFSLENGITALLGNNGSGKSTLINIIVGVVKADCGKVTFNGMDNVKDGKRFRSLLGFLPQDCGYYEEFSAYEFMEYIGTAKGVNRKTLKANIKKYLEFVGLWDVRKKRIKGFSGGMKHRLGIAQAFVSEPDLIILDEPTTGLDEKERNNFKQMLCNYGKNHTVIISTHIMSDIEDIAHNTFFLENGKLIQNSIVHTQQLT